MEDRGGIGKNLQRVFKGLDTDTSYKDTQKDHYRFALNAVQNSNEGNQFFMSNENSNEICGEIPDGYTIIGQCYMSKDKTCLFLVNPILGLSEIGIHYSNCTYETVVSTSELNFSIAYQIDAIYRVRRGCESVVYFTDGLNPVRFFNFGKLSEFKTEGDWDANKFNLFSQVTAYPKFESVTLVEGGNLEAGSYNIAIQYFDRDNNSTGWIEVTDTLIVYQDYYTSNKYQNINGSKNVESFYEVFGLTKKAINITLSNLDTTFPFYQLAIIKATSGTGYPNRVSLTNKIPTRTTQFLYTGFETFTETDVEEITFFKTIIEKAKHITQLDNRLILGNIQGKKISYGELQRYASKIKAEITFNEIVLNDITAIGNNKRGEKNLELVGYMPGEMYSFAIEYLFEDNTWSPAYHIPGRKGYESQMSEENEIQETYTSTNDCGTKSYWGLDASGNQLLGQPVRHHRFPLRSEVEKPLYTESGILDTIAVSKYTLNLSGTLDQMVMVDETYQVELGYDVDGTPTTTVVNIVVDKYLSLGGDYTIDYLTTYEGEVIDNITFIELDKDGVIIPTPTGIGITYSSVSTSENIPFGEKLYKSQIFGIKFTNIDTPQNIGQGIIGYRIVRNEREENNKTILDSAVLIPLSKEVRPNVNYYTSHGFLFPNFADTARVQDDVFAVLHPEFKFLGKEYPNVSRITQEGVYTATTKLYHTEAIESVFPDTSYNKDIHKKKEKDEDGWDLRVWIRNSILSFTASLKNILAEGLEIEKLIYLDAISDAEVNFQDNSKRQLTNLSEDNKIGFVQLKNKTIDPLQFSNKCLYTVLHSNNTSPYADYRTLPYYQCTKIQFFNPSSSVEYQVESTSGDTYISSMKYVSTMRIAHRPRDRKEKKGVLKIVIGGVLIVAGVVLLASGVGAGLGVIALAGASSLVAGVAITSIASGLKANKIAKIYQEDYEKGLKDTLVDDDVQIAYVDLNPLDDEIQYWMDIASDFWFESQVNISWRNGTTINYPPMLPSPEVKGPGEYAKHAIDKLTNENEDRATYKEGKEFNGFAKAEVYSLNLDYTRRQRQKFNFHLAEEFDTCSDCQEDFSNRISWSEQSFQEEENDFYRTFLPNNYKDMPGEGGEVTNLFTIQNNMYVHCEETLWHLPQNIQERVTGDITSFIGTGDYFGIPPRKIVDGENGNSAGSTHKWATIKTSSGVLFVSEIQKQIFLFDGNQLQPISSNNMFHWFKENITLIQDKNYYTYNKELFRYKNNPANLYGTGYISVYDARNERIIISKKDYLITNEFANNSDYFFCSETGQFILFENYKQTIEDNITPPLIDPNQKDWEFKGIENCEMKFVRNTDEIGVGVIPSESDIFMFFDRTSMAETDITNIKTGISSWAIEGGLTNNIYDTEQEFSAATLHGGLRFTEAYPTKYYVLDDTNQIIEITYPEFRDNYMGITDSTRYAIDYYDKKLIAIGESRSARFEPGNIYSPLTPIWHWYSEYWVRTPLEYVKNYYDWKGEDSINKKVILLVFIDEVNQSGRDTGVVGSGQLGYHEGITGLSTTSTVLTNLQAPTIKYIEDLKFYLSTKPLFKSVNALNYPINRSPEFTIPYISHAVPAIKGFGQAQSPQQDILVDVFKNQIVDLGWTYKNNQYPANTGGSEGSVTDSIDSALTLNFKGYKTSALDPITNVNTYVDIDVSSITPLGPILDKHGWDIKIGVEAGDVRFRIGQDINQFLQNTVETNIILGKEYKYIQGVAVTPNTNDLSWTLSYSLKTSTWTSWHSYLPYVFLQRNNDFYSLRHGDTNIWRHNKAYNYQNFYGEQKAFIVESVSLANPIMNKVFDFLEFHTEAMEFDSVTEEYKEVKNKTFNKVLMYNSTQCTGVLDLLVKDTSTGEVSYLFEQVKETDTNQIIIDKNEGNWYLNDIRDVRVDYDSPMFIKNKDTLQPDYYIDKIVNTSVINFNKDWSETEPLKDKFLVFRLIFDNFDNTKLILNYSIENETPSSR